MVGPTPSTKTTTSHQQQQSSIDHTTNQQHTTNQKSGAINTIPPSMFVLSDKIYANKISKNNHLLGFPGLTSQVIIKHFSESTATIQGHLHRQRKNLQSTLKKALSNDNISTSTDDNNPPSEQDASCEIFLLC